MSNNEIFEIGSKYNCISINQGIIGNLSNAEVLGIITHDVANMISDVAVLHTALSSNMDGNYTSYKDYTYVMFKLENGSKVVYGKPWIDMSSVEKVGSSSVTFTLNNINADQVSQIKRTIQVLGFNLVDVKIYNGDDVTPV